MVSWTTAHDPGGLRKYRIKIGARTLTVIKPTVSLRALATMAPSRSRPSTGPATSAPRRRSRRRPTTPPPTPTPPPLVPEPPERPGGVGSIDSRHGRRLAARSTLAVGDAASRSSGSTRCSSYDVARLPYTLRILLENVLRNGRARTSRRSPAGSRPTSRAARSRSRPRACCCRTSPACRRSSTSPRCATRWPTSAATRRGSTR